MPFQDLQATDVFVNVNVASSAIHSRVAEESVKFIETVPSLWLVKIISVSIPVIGEFVASMPSAVFRIIMQFAHAFKDILEIPSPAAILVSTIKYQLTAPTA